MGTRCDAPVWSAHSQNGTIYDLSHVHPFFLKYTLPPQPGKPGRPGFAELVIRIYVVFSHHCFSRNLKNVQTYTEEEIYEDKGRKERRVFCLVRWQLSKKLAPLLKRAAGRKCYHTGKHNFFTVELDGGGAIGEDYVIYFRAERSQLVDIELTIESAYMRTDKPHLSKALGKINLNAILRNALKGTQAHPPPQK